jgi:hypothetical protein
MEPSKVVQICLLRFCLKSLRLRVAITKVCHSLASTNVIESAFSIVRDGLPQREAMSHGRPHRALGRFRVAGGRATVRKSRTIGRFRERSRRCTPVSPPGSRGPGVVVAHPAPLRENPKWLGAGTGPRGGGRNPNEDCQCGARDREVQRPPAADFCDIELCPEGTRRLVRGC